MLKEAEDFAILSLARTSFFSSSVCLLLWLKIFVTHIPIGKSLQNYIK